MRDYRSKLIPAREIDNRLLCVMSSYLVIQKADYDLCNVAAQVEDVYCSVISINIDFDYLRDHLYELLGRRKQLEISKPKTARLPDDYLALKQLRAVRCVQQVGSRLRTVIPLPPAHQCTTDNHVVVLRTRAMRDISTAIRLMLKSGIMR